MKQKGRTSDHIHFPRHSARISRRFDNANGDLLGRAVVISIINYLADVADAAEEVRLPKGHRDRARLENERRKMCESVVRGANDLTALFNSVKGERKYTDPAPKNLPLYRNELRGQVLYPLQRADATRVSFGRPFSFTPYRDKLSSILAGVEREIRHWLRVPRPSSTNEHRASGHRGHRRRRSKRSPSPPPLRGLCTVM